MTDQPTTQRKFDLSPEDAITEMNAILEGMRGDAEREQLKDIDSDTAFELGYETALFDYKRLTGPDTAETGVIVYEKKKDSDE